ncbi:MAG: hypothetical protein ACOCYN_01655 [Planctomycetota bacterium]
MKRRPCFAVPWDARSDQPHRILDPQVRRAARAGLIGEYAQTLATAALVAPLVAARYPTLDAARFAPATRADFCGVALSPRPGRDVEQIALLDELGLRQVLVRIPLGDPRARDAHLALIAALAPRPVLGVLVQDRTLVCRPQRWLSACEDLVSALPGNVTALQIAQAVNRLKWGCASIGEALALNAVIPTLRAVRSDLLILGSSVIDFEPLATARSLLNRHRFRLDGVAAQLYVDRRGGPEGRQWAWFDLPRKLRLLAAITALSPRSADRLWVTEVNWPLRGYTGWAPTSDTECVDEDAAGAHLRAYYRMAWNSGVVERVYWWQLVARGYGLVDDSAVRWRRRPAFTALRDVAAALRRGDALA